MRFVNRRARLARNDFFRTRTHRGIPNSVFKPHRTRKRRRSHSRIQLRYRKFLQLRSRNRNRKTLKRRSRHRIKTALRIFLPNLPRQIKRNLVARFGCILHTHQTVPQIPNLTQNTVPVADNVRIQIYLRLAQHVPAPRFIGNKLSRCRRKRNLTLVRMRQHQARFVLSPRKLRRVFLRRSKLEKTLSVAVTIPHRANAPNPNTKLNIRRNPSRRSRYPRVERVGKFKRRRRAR